MRLWGPVDNNTERAVRAGGRRGRWKLMEEMADTEVRTRQRSTLNTAGAHFDELSDSRCYPSGAMM